jgi:hypothetical protein
MERSSSLRISSWSRLAGRKTIVYLLDTFADTVLGEREFDGERMKKRMLLSGYHFVS